LVRTSGVTPILLADGPDYLFGIASDPTRPKKVARAQRCRQAFLNLIAECAVATGLSEVRAVETFLQSGQVPSEIDPAAHIITFSVDGTVVVDLPAVQHYWRDLQRPANDSETMECLVCGRTAPATDVWPVPIKGIPLGHSSGNALVSANEHAFESYGLEKSRTSPACLDCATDVGKALNWLLEREAHHLRLPSSAFVFWTRGEAEFDLLQFLTEPDPTQVKALLIAPATGHASAAHLDPSRFYAAELAASGSRVAVRTWIESTVPAIREHLKRYFRRQAIVRLDGTETRPMGLRALLFGMVREANDLSAQLTHDLLEVALDGRPVSARLLAAVVRRNQIDRRVTTARAALTKMALLNGPEQEHEELVMTQLDPEERHPAYLCGRLLAELEAAQRAALGRLNQTLTDRFYGGASSSPATVFPPLLRNLRNHMAKLQREKRGAYNAIENRLMDITSGLPARLPTVLTLQEQARFGIGYYHQKAADRAAMRAAGQRETALAAELSDIEEDDQ